MRAFQWDERFITGLERVDDQHRYLVEMVNHLATLAADGTTHESELQTIFNQLAEYANSHFLEEERLMDAYSLDSHHVLMHKKQHADFIRQVSLMWEQRNIADNQIPILHGFLSAWLVAHILGIDHAMSRMVLDVRSGIAPDVAWKSEVARHGENHESILLDALKQLYSVVTKQNRLLSEANQQLVKTMAELEASAHQDALTGLPNRALFLDRLRQALAQAQRRQQVVALLFVDLDRFKLVNDQYGHAIGDAALKEVVERMKSCSRQSDTIGRWGGDEFLMLLPEADSTAGAQFVADKLVEALELTPLLIEDKLCDIGISIGFAIFPIDGATPEALIATADQRMYMQKQAHHQALSESDHV